MIPCAPVWGGRGVWRHSQTPGPRGGGLNAHGVRPVYWRYSSGRSMWTYYNSFTFMLDAATVSSGEKIQDLWRQHAYQRSDVIHPPEVVQAHDPVGRQVWSMFYMVIHPDIGLVSGPDFMYWGSKTIRGAAKHAPDFQCWCVTPRCFPYVFGPVSCNVPYFFLPLLEVLQFTLYLLFWAA